MDLSFIKSSKYTHFVNNSLSDKSFDNIIAIFFNDSSRATMCAAYPMISDLLFRICVLPCSSAHVERLFLSNCKCLTPVMLYNLN